MKSQSFLLCRLYLFPLSLYCSITEPLRRNSCLIHVTYEDCNLNEGAYLAESLKIQIITKHKVCMCAVKQNLTVALDDDICLFVYSKHAK